MFRQAGLHTCDQCLAIVALELLKPAAIKDATQHTPAWTQHAAATPQQTVFSRCDSLPLMHTLSRVACAARSHNKFIKATKPLAKVHVHQM